MLRTFRFYFYYFGLYYNYIVSYYVLCSDKSSNNDRQLKLHVVSGSVNDQSVVIAEPVDFLQSPIDTVYILIISVGIECRLNRLSINMSLLDNRG